MKYTKKLVLIIAAVLLLTLTYNSLILAQGDTRLTILGNDLRVITKEGRAVPMVNIISSVRTGTINEDDKLNGASHYLEHLLLSRGTQKYPSGTLGKTIEDVGGYSNGATSYDVTTYDVVVPADKLELGIEAQAEMLFRATFKGEEFEIEKNAVQEEYRRANDRPWGYIFDRIHEVMLANKHPYSRTVLGTLDGIKTMPWERVRRYYETYYAPNNISLVLTGDFETDKAVELVKKHLGQSKANQLPKVEYPAAQLPEKIKVVQEERDINQTYFVMATLAPSASDPDTYAMDLLAYILSSGRTSKLVRRIKEELHLVNSITASYTTPKIEGPFFVSGNLESKNLLQTVQEVMRIFESVKRGQISEEEFELARRSFVYTLLYGREDPHDVAESMAFWEAKADYTFELTYVDNIRKVTLSDLTRAANRFLTTDRFSLLVTAPKGQAQAELEKKLRDYSAELKKKRSAPATVRRTVLENGITLLSKRNTSSEISSLHLFIRGGACLDGEKSGLAYFCSQLLDRGTKDKNALEVSKYLDFNGLRLSIGPGREATPINLKSPNESFDLGLDLLRDLVLSPTFAASEIEAKRKDILAQVERIEDSPVQLALRHVIKTVFKGHPYANSPEGVRDTIAKITREDIVQFHKASYTPSNMIFAYSGRLSDEAILRRIRERFGHIKSPEPSQMKSDKSIPVLEAAKLASKEVIKKEKMQASIMVAWQIPGASHEDFYAIEVLNSLLGWGPGSRLWKLRQEEGLAYVVGAFDRCYKNGGVFLVYIGTALKNREKAIASLLREIKAVRTTEPSEEEIKKVKTQIYGQYLRDRKLTSDHTLHMARNELLGRDIDFDRLYPERINKVTPKDVLRVAKKYLDEEKYHLVVVGG